MRIEPNESPTELSYLELVNGLTNDVNADEAMPTTVKRKVLEHIQRIQTIIEPYSA